MQYIITEKNQIILTHYDDIKNRAHDSQIASAKKTQVELRRAHKQQTSGTIWRIKLNLRSVIRSVAWPTVV